MRVTLLTASLLIAACVKYVPLSVDDVMNSGPGTYRVTTNAGRAHTGAHLSVEDSVLVISGAKQTEGVTPNSALRLPLSQIAMIEEVGTHDKRTMIVMISAFVVLAVIVTAFASFGL